MPRAFARSPSPQAEQRGELAALLLQRIRRCPWQTARELLAWVNEGRRRKLPGAALVGLLRFLRGLNTRGVPAGKARVQVSGQRSGTRYAAMGCKIPPPPRFTSSPR
jgi:hypothetical protein